MNFSMLVLLISSIAQMPGDCTAISLILPFNLHDFDAVTHRDCKLQIISTLADSVNVAKGILVSTLPIKCLQALPNALSIGYMAGNATVSYPFCNGI